MFGMRLYFLRMLNAFGMKRPYGAALEMPLAVWWQEKRRRIWHWRHGGIKCAAWNTDSSAAGLKNMRDPGWAKQIVKARIDFLAQTLANEKKDRQPGSIASLLALAGEREMS